MLKARKLTNEVTEKIVEVTDNSTGKTSLYIARHTQSARAHAAAEAIKGLRDRFSTRLLSPGEVAKLKNPTYIDLTAEFEVAPVPTEEKKEESLDLSGAPVPTTGATFV